jgi:hypothetical protein
MRDRVATLVFCSNLLLTAGVALAQSTAPAGRWEVEFHGGGGFERTTGEGSGALPSAGAPFTTVVGSPSRRASTWHFGDGALLLNQINSSFTATFLSGRITPLDPVLQSAAARRGSGSSLGFRVGVAITRRFGAEFTLDAAQGRVAFSDDALAGIEATRASFLTALNSSTGLLASGGGIVFINPRLTSVATIDDERGRQIFSTGALTINLAERGRVIPYATIGAGMIRNVGDLPRAALVGTYQFDSLGAATGYFAANETSDATLRVVTARQHPFVTVLGGGVRIWGSNRWGIRADVRAYISRNRLDVLVDASPRVVTLQATTSPPLGVIASNTTPGIQFTNAPAFFGIESTLSGPDVNGFRTFTSSGMALHTSVSAGYFVRF